MLRYILIGVSEVFSVRDYLQGRSMRRCLLSMIGVSLAMLLGCGGGSSTSTTGGSSSGGSGGTGGSGTPTLVSITVSPTAAAIAPGTTQPFTATGTYSDGSSKNITTTA